MNSVLIVLPILSILMFDLGLDLTRKDFAMVAHRPKAVLCGLAGQILMLPIVAWVLCQVFGITGTMMVGLMLIACCPGGSSSNVFSAIAKGDVALSVSLTALSSLITLVTLPIIMGSVVELPVGKLAVQNIVLVLVPVILGMFVRSMWTEMAQKMHKVLSKLAFPALMLLAGLFFIGNRDAIIENFTQMGVVVTILLLVCIMGGWLIGKLSRLNGRERRTLVIEVGMQNAAQAIALATSPFVFNDGAIAVPAIVYALMMNVVLLTYVAFVKNKAIS